MSHKLRWPAPASPDCATPVTSPRLPDRTVSVHLTGPTT